ncbi:protein of unknown function [Salinibacillus kushneri]|uniref:DUF4352 domain-containing protein n=1 Tax=Salinibacillus kushneri TaxID=237682 RepID=A0A1I0IHU2_9BACI|nr:DUF4352 domain-containing protein [Salinibacillus kushneri]SET95670.1 protein of unknown function [Salinibacillus kushneri]
MAEKVKKPFYKKWWVWLIAIIIIAVASTSGGDETETSSNDTSNETANTSEDTNNDSGENNKEEDTKKLPGIGEEVKVGAMTYTINEKSTTEQVGPSSLPEEANGKYVILNITVKNNGDEAVTIDGSFFKLKQGDKTFEADSMASTSANQAEDGSIKNSFFLEQLNPGSEMTGNVAFDVAPEIADSNNLKVEAQEGIFGTVTKNIELK